MTDRPMAAVTSREVLSAAAVLGLAIAVLPLVGGSVLWTRPFWLDEICCTLYPVLHASSAREVIANIAAPKDYAPPLLHLIVWSVGRLTGGVTPIVLRSISLLCVSAALLFVYTTLRRRFERAPSIAGALAVASHPLVLTHTFEGRFYGPWLLFAAGFGWSLSIHHPRRRDAALAVFSVLLVTIHWFGVVSLGLMCFGALMVCRRRWRDGLRLVAPSAAGLIALFACIPMVISQRATSNGVLWVPELNSAQIDVMLRLFFLTTVPVLAVILLLVDVLRETSEHPSVIMNVRGALGDPGIAALASLALMPVALVVISVLLQPSMLDRYAIVTVLAWPPFVALAVETVGRVARGVAVAFLVVLMCLGLQRSIQERRRFQETVAANSAAFELAKKTRLPVVFHSILALYPVAGLARDTAALFLELPDSTIYAMVPPRLSWLRRDLRVERNIALGHAHAYGFPRIASQSQLDSTTRFLFIASDQTLPRLYQSVDLFTATVFPHHRLMRLSPNLALLER